MGFADFYFQKYPTQPALIFEEPAPNLRMIITIPSYNEENTIKALESLYFCAVPNDSVEVMVIVNYPETQNESIQNQHHLAFKNLCEWVSLHKSEKLRFHVLIQELPSKTAGVGLARKIVMDEALRRFNRNNYPDGIIVGFDADCTCDPNYLIEVERLFNTNPQASGCSIYYEHPVQGNEFPEKVYEAIIQYELYLRNYIEALRTTGFP
jgi:cellulose synthase/poly-beta-1,6-N-acetylglucosamine synthase-like glycosyltransferase